MNKTEVAVFSQESLGLVYLQICRVLQKTKSYYQKYMS